MIETTATVIEKHGYYAWMEARSRSACSACSSQSGCGTSLLGGVFAQRKNRFLVIDHLNMQVGEQAVLGISAGGLVQAAFLAYLVPLLVMMTVSVTASYQGLGNTAVLLLSMFSLLAGFMLTRWVNRHVIDGPECIRILRRTGHVDAGERTIPFSELQGNHYE